MFEITFEGYKEYVANTNKLKELDSIMEHACNSEIITARQCSELAEMIMNKVKSTEL